MTIYLPPWGAYKVTLSPGPSGEVTNQTGLVPALDELPWGAGPHTSMAGGELQFRSSDGQVVEWCKSPQAMVKCKSPQVLPGRINWTSCLQLQMQQVDSRIDNTPTPKPVSIYLSYSNDVIDFDVLGWNW